MVPKLVAIRPATKDDDLSRLPLDIILIRLGEKAPDELRAIRILAVDCLRRIEHAA